MQGARCGGEIFVLANPAVRHLSFVEDGCQQGLYCAATRRAVPYEDTDDQNDFLRLGWGDESALRLVLRAPLFGESFDVVRFEVGGLSDGCIEIGGWFDEDDELPIDPRAPRERARRCSRPRA